MGDRQWQDNWDFFDGEERRKALPASSDPLEQWRSDLST